MRLWCSNSDARSRAGFTLVEVVIVLAILTTLGTVALPLYGGAVQEAKTTLAIGDIQELQSKIELHEICTGTLPASLHSLGTAPTRDPWGAPYEYRRRDFVKSGQRRLDRFLLPLNTSYDLYSRGPDGRSASPLTARLSRDDIVRALDGRFVGVARDY